MNRRLFLAGAAASCFAQEEAPAVPFVCPMDPDVRSPGPARCPRCGMALVAGIPDPLEFHVDFHVQPAVPRPHSPVEMRFRVLDPKTLRPAKLQIIHEKLFHLFLVGSDLEFFAHEHPELQSDGSFLFSAALPHTGLYRVLCDFYPENGTPQMIARTLLIPGPSKPSALQPDLSSKTAETMRIALRTDPPQPLAGKKTMLFFDLDPAEGLEQYLGAWGHMLAASSDLIDMLHAHPAWEDRQPAVQFNIIFPRPGTHRVWVQFQRRGIVNTVAFNVPVAAL